MLYAASVKYRKRGLFVAITFIDRLSYTVAASLIVYNESPGERCYFRFDAPDENELSRIVIHTKRTITIATGMLAMEVD